MREANVIGDLAPREQAVVRLYCEGLCHKEIGARLGMSSHTVNQHLSIATFKARLKSRKHLKGKFFRLVEAVDPPVKSSENLPDLSEDQ